VVGHYNSGVALPASEVYKESMLAMISPANTATEITDRRYPNINRCAAVTTSKLQWVPASRPRT